MDQQPDPESDDGYRPSEAEPYMNSRQLAYFRRKLTAWRDDLTAAAEEALLKLLEGGKGCPDPVDRAAQEQIPAFAGMTGLLVYVVAVVIDCF